MYRLFIHIGVCVILTTVDEVRGHSRGAPVSPDVCRDLTPRHRVDAQPGDSPYWLHAVHIPGTNSVNVSLYAPNGFPFKGFMLQARDDYDSIVNGEFSESAVTKAISCLNTRANTLTHNSNQLKYVISTIWTSHSAATQIRFKCTVVVEKLRFYVNLLSSAIVLNPSPTLQPSTEVTRPQTAVNFPETAYEGCGTNKTCFGLRNCVPTKNCDLLLTGQMVNDDIVRFEMYGNIRNTAGDRWFSMGLSRNGKMTDSSVTDCIALTGKSNVILQDSWNQGYSNQIHNPISVTPVINSIQDGYVKCVWERAMVTKVNGQTFDLSKSYILLATGSATGNDKHEHDEKVASSSVIDFRTAGVVGAGGSNKLVKAHGSLMVIAWLGIVSVGIMLARHYKAVWDDRELLGNKVWFTCHRGLMLLSVICAAAGMACIFIFYGWKINTLHAKFGVAANCFMIFQPLVALCRCHPGTENRWIFNWVHWFGGNAGQIVALCAIFLATYLPATGLSMVFLWLVIAFLAMHITVHLILQIHARFLANDNKVSDNIAMQDIHRNKSAVIQDNGETFKQLMLGVYVVLVAVVVLALILIIAFAKQR